MDTHGNSPGKLAHHSSVVIGDTMYLFGGSSQSHENSQVYALNMVTYEWRLLKATGEDPGTLDEHTAVPFKNGMVLFGGFTSLGRTNNVWLFNIDEKKWELREQGEDERRYPKARTGHTSVVMGEKMWMFGGQDDESTKLNDIWCYNIPTDSWEKIEADPSTVP